MGRIRAGAGAGESAGRSRCDLPGGPRVLDSVRPGEPRRRVGGVRSGSRFLEQGSAGPDLAGQHHQPAGTHGPVRGVRRAAWFRAGPDSRISRLNVTAGGAAEAAHLCTVAGRLAQTMGGIDVRAVSFAVRPPRRIFAGVEESADDLVADAWLARVRESLGDQRIADTLVIGSGLTWSEAIEQVSWRGGDLLLVGPSSAAGPARLFLGSGASKILHSAPIPVLLVPAGDG